MADAADDRELVSKSVRPVGPLAMPPRPGEAIRRFADPTYQLKPDSERSCLSVGRGITLSGEVNSCDKLFIEGSVDAKLTNCRAIEIAESGLFKGSTSIEEAETTWSCCSDRPIGTAGTKGWAAARLCPTPSRESFTATIRPASSLTGTL